jgi:beta-phosphoglucomutase
MEWIKHFQLFLFDFDGLLVNTEQLHFEAYIEMCRRHGFALKWDFERFCGAAHFDATALRDAIYEEFPQLHAKEPKWDVLYAEKKRAYMELLKSGRLHLMPGVEKLLETLAHEGVKRCVVTHSPSEQVDYIRSVLPQLDSIPHWITREHYENPKPAPDSYFAAIERFAARGDKIVGFEDSMRGLQALRATPARPVLISTFLHPQLTDAPVHFNTFEEIPPNWTP